MNLYLDANAHVPMSEIAAKTFYEVSKDPFYGNAMAATISGRRSANLIEQSRSTIAELIGAQSSEQIFFTSSATQACEWSLEILKNQNFENIWRSELEHPAVKLKSKDIYNKELFVSKSGLISCGFTPQDNSAFICMSVQNEIGTIQNINEIKVPFFSDMSQTLGKLSLNVSSLSNLKIAAFSSHKFGGPTSVGFIYLQDPYWWIPFGEGSRYLRDRPGTPDTAGIAATAAALNYAIKTMTQRYEKALIFSQILEKSLTDMGIEIIGTDARRIPHTTFFKTKDSMGPYIISQLEAEGIQIGRGSACTSTSLTNSTMRALGHGSRATGYVRISQWGDYSAKEAKILAQALKKYISK